MEKQERKKALSTLTLIMVYLGNVPLFKYIILKYRRHILAETTKSYKTVASLHLCRSKNMKNNATEVHTLLDLFNTNRVASFTGISFKRSMWDVCF